MEVKKFRKKPVVSEAMQWDGRNVYEMYCFIEGKQPDNHSCRMAIEAWLDYTTSLLNKPWRIKTLESDNETQIASVGDWIIKGIQGEFYPCKPDIFPEIYEEVLSELTPVQQGILNFIKLMTSSDGGWIQKHKVITGVRNYCKQGNEE